MESKFDKFEKKKLAAILYILKNQQGSEEFFDEELIDFLSAHGLYDPKSKTVTKWGDDLLASFKSNPRAVKLGRTLQKRVSLKIRKLRREGYSAKQAAAIAYRMARNHKIGPRGGKKNPDLEHLFETYLEIPNPKGCRKNPDFADRDLASIVAFMLYLQNYPYMYKNVPDKLMEKLVEQKLFDEKKLCLTEKGEKFIEEARKSRKNPSQIPIINNTDLSWKRLLVLYDKELGSIKDRDVDFIIFDPEKMTVWGKSKKILEVDDAKKNPRSWKERRFFDYILNHGYRTIKSLDRRQKIILDGIKYAASNASDVKHLAILGKRVLTEGIREA